jgi:hypothetical protein
MIEMGHKADIDEAEADVRYVTIGDKVRRSKQRPT